MNSLVFLLPLFLANIKFGSSNSICGCKTTRKCYLNMIEALKARDEQSCIEDAAIGSSTIIIFLKALTEYCGNYITSNIHSYTFEGKGLYEVILTNSTPEGKPVILLEAGQYGGWQPVELALYVIQQLVACQEYEDMIEKATWIILPSTNPDGMEFKRFSDVQWNKNFRHVKTDKMEGHGVDVSRNFDSQWASCGKNNNPFSPTYAGPSAGSEKETIFIKDTITKYKGDIKAYLSIRKDGHALMYPYAWTNSPSPHASHVSKVGAEVTARVNQRAGTIQLFLNDTIYNLNGKPHCGHSVDYAHEQGIKFAYEMRVFLGSDNKVMSEFHTLPRGYEGSLRMGYFSGIRELFNIITNEKKYGKVCL